MYDSDNPDQTKPGGSEPSPSGLGALARVAEALGDPEQRQGFISDPTGTVKGYESLPESVRSTLEGLSHEELDVLARTHQAFADAGLYTDVDDEHGGGRVSFF